MKLVSNDRTAARRKRDLARKYKERDEFIKTLSLKKDKQKRRNPK